MTLPDTILSIVIAGIALAVVQWWALRWVYRRIVRIYRYWKSDEDATYISDVGRYRH